MRKRIGGRIESARKVRRMTQAQLAEELTKIIGQPVSERTIGEMERGKRPISAECICALSKTLVVPVCNLLSAENEKDPDDVTVADAFQMVEVGQFVIYLFLAVGNVLYITFVLCCHNCGFKEKTRTVRRGGRTIRVLLVL